MSATTPPSGGQASRLASWFHVAERGSTVRTEIIGGVTTFMTMAYILFVNGAILSAAGLAPAQVLTVTALVAGVMTILMGVVGGYPFAIAPGLGLNAVVAFGLVGRDGLTAPEAMGLIVLEGLAVVLLVLLGFREAVLNAVPMSLKKAIGAGIGLFIALIGFGNGGLTVPGSAGGPLLSLGQVATPRVLLFLLGVLLALVLVARRVRGALLYAIVATTILAVVANELGYDGKMFTAPGVGRVPERLFSLPDFSLVGAFSFGGIAKLGFLAAVMAIFSLLLTDFFDTVGTAVGLAGKAGFLDARGALPGMGRVLLVDSLGAVAGGVASSSSATTYIESAAGISEGARTGLASVITGLLFLAAMFIAPLAGVIPAEATAGALVVVGFLMLGILRDIDWDDVTEAAPAFLTVIGMPFTFSIADGIGLGFLGYSLLKAATGRAREVHPLMWVASAAFALFFALPVLERALGK